MTLMFSCWSARNTPFKIQMDLLLDKARGSNKPHLMSILHSVFHAWHPILQQKLCNNPYLLLLLFWTFYCLALTIPWKILFPFGYGLWKASIVAIKMWGPTVFRMQASTSSPLLSTRKQYTKWTSASCFKQTSSNSMLAPFLFCKILETLVKHSATARDEEWLEEIVLPIMIQGDASENYLALVGLKYFLRPTIESGWVKIFS